MIPQLVFGCPDRNVFDMTALQNSAFSNLLRAWNQRQELRSSDAEIRQLADARYALDTARAQMRNTMSATH